MAKPRTKKQIFQSYSDHICPDADSKKPIKTKPTIPCDDVLESVVQTDCVSWLKKRRIVGDRNNTGLVDVRGQKIYFGIKHGGDWIGLLPNGRHLEIEFKRGRGGKLSVGQQERRKKIIMNNGVYLVVHSGTELELLMEKYLRR